MAIETTETINDTIKAIISNQPDNKIIKEALKEVDPAQHKVKNKKFRKDKPIETDEGPSTVLVSRIPVALQKLIVSRAASFLIGKPIRLVSDAEDKTIEGKLFLMLKKTWEDNKLDFRSKKLAKHMMSETECAEIWYSEEVKPEYWGELGNSNTNTRLRVKLVAPSLGDTLYPGFDLMGNLIYFGRKYSVKQGKELIEHFDLYTDEDIYYTTKGPGQVEWTLVNAVDEEGNAADTTNPVGKIPVIYYNQDRPEWADVQDAIERLETLISNFADTNDYFASPMVFIEGDVTGFAKKGEQGKVLKGKAGAKASYLTWDGAPEAIKLEIETLFDIIYTMTQTPDISFKGMKGLGATPSGVAMDRVLIDGQLKAKDKQEDTFGECIQRRVNLLKALMPLINEEVAKASNMSIWAEFQTFKMDNVREDLDNILIATGNKPFMSIETARELNPLISDAVEEKTRMEAEADLTDPLIQ